MKKYLIGQSSRPDEEEGGKRTSDEEFATRRVKKIKYDMKHAGELCVINSHPRDTELEFVEEGHYYKKRSGGRFRISVSGFKGHFLPPFASDDSIASKFQFPQKDKDGNLILKNGRKLVGRSPSAKKNPPDFGLTRRECIEKQRATSVYGTMIHAKAEKYLELQLDPAMPKERRMAYFLQAREYTTEDLNIAKQVVEAELQWISEGWTVYRTEWSVFDEDFDIAGQIDIVLKRMNGLEAEYAVVDWKTTRFSMNTCFSWGKFENAFYPFDEFRATLGNQYLLQMSLYARKLKYKYDMNVVMVRAIGLHKDKPQGETRTWTDIPFNEVERGLMIWKNFLELEKHIKEWEEDGLTAEGLFPSLPEPPFFRKIQDDPLC